MSVAGRPANPEDLLIAYALGVPYVGQHGDDSTRWALRFGDLSVDAEDSLAMSAPVVGNPPRERSRDKRVDKRGCVRCLGLSRW